MNFSKLLVPPDKVVKLKDYPTGRTDSDPTKEEAAEQLQADIAKLGEWQDKLAAQNSLALLVILQGIDAAGKDGTVRHVMSGVNPSGCQVRSFKVPSDEELDHDYLWRYSQALPERGNIGIFNRSHYEEVLVVRVHPELLARQRIDPGKKKNLLWKTRYEQINNFEQYLVENGVEVLKFFLHLSKEEQKKRFLARLDMPTKNWKFSEGDVKERAFWDAYQEAFQDMLSHTSTKHAPWYVIPADQKWLTRMAVADITVRKLASLPIEYPQLDAEKKKSLEKARQLLENEQ